MDYSKYPKNWLTEIRPKVLARDGYMCTRCGASGGQYKINMRTGNIYRVYLSVAHLDHDKENFKVKLSRLAVMCQSCHIFYDNKTDPVRISWQEKYGRLPRGRKKASAKARRLSRLERQYYYWGEVESHPRCE